MDHMWKSEQKAAALQAYGYAAVLESMRKSDVRLMIESLGMDPPDAFRDKLWSLAKDKTQGIKPIRALGEALLAFATFATGATLLVPFFNDHPDYAVYTLLHLLAIDAAQMETRDGLLNETFDEIRRWVNNKCRKAVQTFLSLNFEKAIEGAFYEQYLDTFDRAYEAAKLGETIFVLPAFVQDSNVFYYWKLFSPAFKNNDVTIEWSGTRLNPSWWPKLWQSEGAL